MSIYKANIANVTNFFSLLKFNVKVPKTYNKTKSQLYTKKWS